MKKFITLYLIFSACFIIGCGTAKITKSVSAPVVIKFTDVIDENASSNAYTDGLIAYSQGRIADAEKAWELAVRYNPKNEKARIALERVKREIKLEK